MKRLLFLAPFILAQAAQAMDCAPARLAWWQERASQAPLPPAQRLAHIDAYIRQLDDDPENGVYAAITDELYQSPLPATGMRAGLAWRLRAKSI